MQFEPHSVIPVLAIILITNKWRIILGEIKLQPQVTTEEGTLRGTTLKSRNGRPYYAFEGVRYAEKPERFKIAQPRQSWKGVVKAMKPGDVCKQNIPVMGTLGSEDCLFLNVYTAIHEDDVNEKQDKLPVIVFIHGGAFIFGSSDMFGSPYWLDEDVVLVTINYRLGALGFLYNEDDQIPGNLGMRDQVAALEWIQRNVEHFGGDRNLVTLIGESAGAASIQFLMLSPMAKGLFHRAILQSGSALCPWALQKRPKDTCKKFAAAMDCPTENPLEMVDCLRAADAEKIVDVQSEKKFEPMIPEIWFSPVVETGPHVNEDNVFLGQHPRKLLTNLEIVNSVPAIFGMVKNEGVGIFSGFILNDEDSTEELNGNWSHIAPFLFLYNNDRLGPRPKPLTDAISTKIRHFYFGNPPSHIGYETEQSLTDLFSDRMIVHAVMDSARFHSQLSPTYLYHFTFTTGSSVFDTFGFENFDPPTHADDVPYFFPTMPLKPYLASKFEVQFSQKIIKLFTSFARTGIPSATWGSAKDWPMIGRNDSILTMYQLDNDTKLVKELFPYRMNFWDDLVANELQHE